MFLGWISTCVWSPLESKTNLSRSRFCIQINWRTEHGWTYYKVHCMQWWFSSFSNKNFSSWNTRSHTWCHRYHTTWYLWMFLSRLYSLGMRNDILRKTEVHVGMYHGNHMILHHTHLLGKKDNIVSHWIIIHACLNVDGCGTTLSGTI